MSNSKTFLFSAVLSVGLSILTPSLKAQTPPNRAHVTRPQVGRPLVTKHVLPAPPPSPAVRAFRSSPTYNTRQIAFKASWLNLLPTVVKYPDGHSLTISTIQNPPEAYNTPTVTNTTVPGPTQPDPTQPGFICSTNQVQLTANSSNFLVTDYANANAYIYPGAIFTPANFFSGNYKEQQGVRNPITLLTDSPNVKGKGSVVVQVPNAVNIRGRLDELTRSFYGPAASEGFAESIIQSNNSSDLNIQLSGGASGYGISFSDAFGMKTNSSSVSITIDARSPIFSISVVPPENGFFKNKAIENTPNLMVISNVTYGVRVLANLNVTFNSSKDANTFKASYNGFEGSANAMFGYLSKNSSSVSSVNVYVVGGATNTHTTLNASNLQAGINKILNSVSYLNARPLSYQFMDMAGDLVGVQSATDNFSVRQCVPSTADPKITSIRADFTTGHDGKDGDTNLNLYLYPTNFINSGDTSDNGDMTGALYGYQSKGHSSAFGTGQTNSLVLTPRNGKVCKQSDTACSAGPPQTKSWFNQGAHLRIHIYPNWTNTWDVASIALTLNYDDGTSDLIQGKAASLSTPFWVSDKVTTKDIYIPAGLLP